MYGAGPIGDVPTGGSTLLVNALASASQSFSPGDIVIMFDIDTSPIGGTDIWRVCSGVLPDGSMVVWQGNTYTPFPIMATGFDWSGRGALPKPKMTVSNVSGLLQAATIQYSDLLGAKVTRWKTLSKFLDNQPMADPDCHYIPDIYYIDRKSQQTKTMIEFELAAALDQQGKQLPRRQAVRDNCSETYRVWNPITLAFTPGTCPYAGGTYFDRTDAQTLDPAADSCSNKLSGCKARYGVAAELPFAGFPALSRLR